MRLEGTIRDWNDDRGFGFIAPTRGGEDIFFHVSVFVTDGERPRAGQAVTFQLEHDSAGRPRATAVEPLDRHGRATVQAAQRGGPTRWKDRGNFATLGFVLLYLWAAGFWQVPPWVAGFYLLASVLAFAIYGLDKAAARASTRRVPEPTLLVIGLFGGWPGARIAQVAFRHKTSKTSFQIAFWITVALNVAAFVAIFSPLTHRNPSL